METNGKHGAEYICFDDNMYDNYLADDEEYVLTYFNTNNTREMQISTSILSAYYGVIGDYLYCDDFTLTIDPLSYTSRNVQFVTINRHFARIANEYRLWMFININNVETVICIVISLSI